MDTYAALNDVLVNLFRDIMELEEQAFCGLSDEERTILMELFIKIYYNTMVGKEA